MNLTVDQQEMLLTCKRTHVDRLFPDHCPVELRKARKRLKDQRARRGRQVHLRTKMAGVGREAAGLFYEPRIIPPTEPVNRDPCPRCGVRGDIPCGHSKTRLGMVL